MGAPPPAVTPNRTQPHAILTRTRSLHEHRDRHPQRHQQQAGHPPPRRHQPCAPSPPTDDVGIGRTVRPTPPHLRPEDVTIRVPTLGIRSPQRHHGFLGTPHIVGRRLTTTERHRAITSKEKAEMLSSNCGVDMFVQSVPSPPPPSITAMSSSSDRLAAAYSSMSKRGLSKTIHPIPTSQKNSSSAETTSIPTAVARHSPRSTLHIRCRLAGDVSKLTTISTDS